jgi:hypothetical protein
VGIVAAAYHFLGSSSGSTVQTTSSAATTAPPATTSSVQKFVEVSGIRFSEDPKNKKKAQVRFMVTNHSDSDLLGMIGTVTLWGHTPKSEKYLVGTFPLTADVKAQSYQEKTAPLDTKLEYIELPDWQFLTIDLQITSPQ